MHTFLRPIVVLALAIAVIFARPAQAANLLEAGQVTVPGAWRIQSKLFYTPYFLTLIGGQPLAKDCSDPPAPAEVDKCPPKVIRPIESRHFVQLATTAETALFPGLGLRIGLPIAYVQQYSGAPAKLPPGVAAPLNFGVGDLSLGLERSLYEFEGGALSATLRANVPPMPSALGNEIYPCLMPDAAGKPTLKEFVVFPGAPSADLVFAFSQAIFPEVLLVHGNLSINFPFRRTGIEAATTWRGMRYDYGAGLEYWPLPLLGLHLESLVEWANPAEQVEAGRPDHILVCNTGHIRADLAPGVAVRIAEGVTLRAAVSTPIFQSGYQRDFPLLAGSVGLSLDL